MPGKYKDLIMDTATEELAHVEMIAGTNPQHRIVNGLGPALAEMQGRLQAVRVLNMTGDSGVREMLSFNIARDTMHQNQWLAAMEELKRDGLEHLPVPSHFPESDQNDEYAYTLFGLSEGDESAEGRWASGPSPDGKGQFRYVPNPGPMTPEPVLAPIPPRLYGTPSAGGGIIQKVKDVLS